MGPGIKKLGLVRHLSKPRNQVWFGGLYHVKSGLVKRVLS